MGWVGWWVNVWFVHHVCRLTDEAELGFPTTIACTRAYFSSFLAPICVVHVMYKGEAVLQLSSANWARFGGTRQRETTSALPKDECFLCHRIRSFAKHLTCMSCGIMLGSVWPCRSWQKIHRDIVLAECLLPCQGTSSRKKIRATPQFTIHSEYLPNCPICSTLSRPFNRGMAGKAIAKMVEPWPKSTLQNTTSELNAGLQQS